LGARLDPSRIGGGDIARGINNNWSDIATALETEITLKGQPRGVELEYRVVAVNKAGDSPPSNTETAVLFLCFYDVLLNSYAKKYKTDAKRGKKEYYPQIK